MNATSKYGWTKMNERQCFDKNKNSRTIKTETSMSRLPWTFLWGIQSTKPNKDRKKKKKKRNSQRTNTDRGKKSNDTWGSKRRRFCNSSFSFSETDALKVELFCWCVIPSHLAAIMDTEEKSDRWGKERTWCYLLFGMMQSTPPHPLHPPHHTPSTHPPHPRPAATHKPPWTIFNNVWVNLPVSWVVLPRK